MPDFLPFRSLQLLIKAVLIATFTLSFDSVSGAPPSPGKNTGEERKIVFLGDSLTAGYGVEEQQAFPSLISEKLRLEGHNRIRVINAGVSGSTSASGLSRLRWQLKGKPTHLVLALGANDGLRGFKLDTTEKNLREIISSAQKKQIRVLLAGMKVPPNYGKEYGEKFDAMFTRLAATKGVVYYPFLLDKVAGEKSLNLADGIHPNPEGHALIAKRLYPVVKSFLNLSKP